MSRCGTCGVALNSGEELRNHYNSEFHLTNVRRRVDGQRAMTAVEFRRSGIGREDTDDGVPEEAPVFSCTLCKKTFRSVQTLQTHIRSTAHLMRKEQRIIDREGDAAASVMTTSTLGSAAMGLHRRHKNKKGSAAMRAEREAAAAARPKVSLDEREEDVSSTRCMLCGFLSESVEDNVAHLASAHDFHIPMDAHCVDMEGMLEYLARKVNGLMCIVCGEKTRAVSSLTALRDHMRECGHDRVVLNPEYNAFYDCALEDPDNVEQVELDGVQGDQLVIADEKGNKKVLLKREADVPRPRPRESTEATERRHMITYNENQALMAVRKEQRELMQPSNNENARVAKRSGAELQAEHLKVGMLSNKLHPKGFDGNMQFS